ncbi:hypothetical protein THAOC_36695, partial [Thalassiosira oceanica]
FEVDGLEERLYCQNLCYIAKLFLDHKTLYFDVDPFLFYVLCEVDNRGYHPVGYYSKEKYSDVGYNLACILTFPAHQRKGYGRFLIAFSYELSKKEEKVGSPEKPMSDLGQQAYIPYWTSTIVDFLLHGSGDRTSMSVMDIARRTSIMAEDIIFALNTLGILKFVNGVYFIAAGREDLEDLARRHPVKEPRVDPSRLHWTPYLNDVPKRDKFSISSKKPSTRQGCTKFLQESSWQMEKVRMVFEERRAETAPFHLSATQMFAFVFGRQRFTTTPSVDANPSLFTFDATLPSSSAAGAGIRGATPSHNDGERNRSWGSSSSLLGSTLRSTNQEEAMCGGGQQQGAPAALHSPGASKADQLPVEGVTEEELMSSGLRAA